MSIPPSPYTDMLDSGPIPSVTQTTLLPSWPKRKLLVEICPPPLPQWVRDKFTRKHYRSVNDMDVKPEPIDSGEVASLMERITNKRVQKKKAKGDAADLNSDTVFSIMKELELVHIPVEKENGDLSCMHEPVNRDFLSNVFGGSKVGAYPTPALDKVKMHNIKCFLCPNLDFNPRAAQMPGAPGLMFHFGTRLLKRGDRLIIPNIMEKTKGVHPTFPGIGTSKWLYVGHYKLIDGRALSTQEFCQQTQASRNMWVAVIKNYGWTRPLRAYLRFRRTLADPTKDEVEEMAQKMRTKKSLEDVTSAEIEDAFITGSLKICARGMQCVYYDEAFQRDLIKKFGNWTRKRKSENKVKDQFMERVVHENSSMVENETVEIDVDLRNSKRRRIDDSESEPGVSEDSEVMNIDNLSEIRE